MKNYVEKEISLSVKDRRIRFKIVLPFNGQQSEDQLTLMTFASDLYTSLNTRPYCIQADMFLKKGHRVLSFDLPNHGERVNEYGSEIAGLRNAFVNGNDPFAIFVEDAKAVIDYCLEHGFARDGKIAVAGTSRAGYMALRLMAEDIRVCAGAAFAPVTDWKYLEEFSKDKDRKDVDDLRLMNYCDRLAGRPVFIAIGNHDDRVSTTGCCRFYLELLDKSSAREFDSSIVDFYCTNDPGHSLDDFWRGLGGEFLLKHNFG